MAFWESSSCWSLTKDMLAKTYIDVAEKNEKAVLFRLLHILQNFRTHLDCSNIGQIVKNTEAGKFTFACQQLRHRGQFADFTSESHYYNAFIVERKTTKLL